MARIHASGNVSGVEPETPLGVLRDMLIARQVDGEQGLSPDEEIDGGVSSPALEAATTTSSPSSPARSTKRSTKKTGSPAPAPTTASP